MKQQSATYNPFTDTRTVDFEISFGLINEAAKDNAVASANNTTPRTSVGEVLDRRYTPLQNWATFEPRGWILGGGNKILPADSSGKRLGWWSGAAAGADSKFAADDSYSAILGIAKLGFMKLGNSTGAGGGGFPVLKFEFDEPITTYGWSLTFDENNDIFPTRFRLTAYAADKATKITVINVDNNSPKATVENIVENYSLLQIEFLAMNKPYTKVRLLEIDFGVTQVFNKDTLVKATVAEGVDIAAEALPSRQLTFVFDNSRKIYNMLKPDMLYDYFSSGSEIFAKIIINDEAVDLGKFYFTNATTKSNSLTAEITANDIIMRLNDIMFSKKEGESMTLSAAVELLLDGIDVEKIYDEGIADRLVYFSPFASVSKREVLRMLAQAAMCTCYADRNGAIRFKRVETAEEFVSEINKDALYNYNGISVGDPVSKIILTANDPTIYGGIRQFEAGNGANVIEVTNPCVHDESGAEVAAWLLACYKRRIHYKVKNRCDPAVEIGDTVRLDDAYGENLNASVTGIDMYYTGGVYANTEAII